jgi:hypothetical protein
MGKGLSDSNRADMWSRGWTYDELGVRMHPTYTYVLTKKDWRSKCQAYRICVFPSLNSILLTSKFNIPTSL